MRDRFSNQEIVADSIREFGKSVPGANYVLRPGGYAVIFRGSGEVAVVTTPRGCFLPGGGQEPGETPALAAVRETREECGLRIGIVAPIATADELVHAADEATYFRKRCTFFLAELIDDVAGDREFDSALSWLSPEEAAARLLHESQSWAVAEGCRIANQREH